MEVFEDWFDAMLAVGAVDEMLEGLEVKGLEVIDGPLVIVGVLDDAEVSDALVEDLVVVNKVSSLDS